MEKMADAIKSQKNRVLIIDDEIDIRSVLKETLEYEGFQVETAASSDEAMEQLGHGLFNLILVDIRLEGPLSGVEVVKMCKFAAGNPKVAVISATPYRLLKDMFENRGEIFSIKDYFEKPTDLKPDIFMSRVKKILSNEPEKK